MYILNEQDFDELFIEYNRLCDYRDQLKEKLKRTYRHGDSYYSILLKLQDIYKRIDIIEDCCFSDLGLSHEDLIKISNELYQYNKQAEQRDRYKLHF